LLNGYPVERIKRRDLKLRKIPLPADVHAKLEKAAKIKGLTPDELASKIILEKSTCHNCGLESVDDCVQEKHIPADPTKFPCIGCVRNPERNTQLISRDFWNECWTLDEKNLPFIER
jgi:hypothetical protein